MEPPLAGRSAHGTEARWNWCELQQSERQRVPSNSKWFSLWKSALSPRQILECDPLTVGGSSAVQRRSRAERAALARGGRVRGRARRALACSGPSSLGIRVVVWGGGRVDQTGPCCICVTAGVVLPHSATGGDAAAHGLRTHVCPLPPRDPCRESQGSASRPGLSAPAVRG